MVGGWALSPNIGNLFGMRSLQSWASMAVGMLSLRGHCALGSVAQVEAVAEVD